jgi:glucan biosynthesis protein C
MYGFGGNFAWMGLHLWYLEILFIISLVCLPLMLWLKRGLGARLLAALTRPLAQPGAVYLLALPIMLLLGVLDPAEPLGLREMGGWSFVLYILFFLYGFVLVSDAGTEGTVRRQRWISLAAGLALVAALILVLAGRSDPVFGTPRFRLVSWLFGISSWCWILAIWGFGTQHLTFKTPFLAYTNEAVLPFYVLHQTVLLAVGYFVVGWAIPDLLKYLVIAASSFALIMVIYEFLVRRHNLLRFLFGMKPLRRATQPTAPATAPQTAR